MVKNKRRRVIKKSVTVNPQTRLFVAIELSDEVKEKTSALIGELKSPEAKVKWVEKENLHLTLKFIGEVIEEKVPQIEVALKKAVESVKKTAGAILNHGIKISFKGLGAYPRLNHPRVLWLGVETGAVKLEALANAVEEQLAEIGFVKEPHPFKGHLTIGRVKEGVPRFEKDLTGLKDEGFGEMEIKKISLIQSVLDPSGPKYKVVKEFSLA